MIRIQKIFIAILFSVLIVSCDKKKNEIIQNPQPNEPELITTVQIKATKLGDINDVSYFKYKVENGFHGTQANFQADTIVLKSGSIYDIEMSVLDEKSSPTIDVTGEIIEEKNSHLFYFESTPDQGIGSIRVFNKDKDGYGQDFGQICKWQTGSSGTGKLRVVLIHGPRDKEAKTRDAIAGATDADATFHVRLQ